MATNECNCNNADGTQVRPIYYKDDLDFYMKLLDCDDENIGVPDFDWEARLWTSSRLNYVIVSSVGGVKTNWRDEGDGRIHVVVDNPGLMPGDVHIDFEALLPNETFADGTRKFVKPFTAPIRLTRDCAPCPSAMEIELMLPYVRGKALTFDDLTDAEKDAFAQQAADRVTIENLGVASDAEVDEAMGELLDTLPAVKKNDFHLDRRIRRGIMPAKARPGIVYYDYGFIKKKVCDSFTDIEDIQYEWDITAYGEFINCMQLYWFNSIEQAGFKYRVPREKMKITHIGERYILDFKENFIPCTGDTLWLFLDNTGDIDFTNNKWIGERLSTPRGVMFIGADGTLHRRNFKSDGTVNGLSDITEYSPTLTEKAHKSLVDWLDGTPPLGFEAKKWKGEKSEQDIDSGDRKRHFRKVTKYAKKANGIYIVRLKTRKRYKSKWLKIYKAGTDRVLIMQ